MCCPCQARDIPPFTCLLSGLVAEDNLPFHPGASIDSPICLLKKNSSFSNPCWSAREQPPAWRASNPGMRSTSAIWCNYGQVRIHTGRRAYFWSAECTRTAASAVLCCGPTGAAIGKPGTRTARPSSCASAEARFLRQERPSTAPATLPIARDVWGGTAGSKHLIRYRNQNPSVPNDCRLAGFRPDNEHHAAARSP